MSGSTPSMSPSPPLLVVVIDCEEEFDWDHPVRGAPFSVKSTSEIGSLQTLMSRYGVKPTYVVDYKIVEDDQAWRPLLAWRDRDECRIGAHLHPWVTPPFDEEPIPANSFQGNLPRELELAKMRHLSDLLTSRFAERPTVFRAGRYGIGDRTAGCLVELGYEIDVSYMPHYSYATEGGHDFRSAPVEPFWLRPRQELLEIPVTAGFTGLAWRAGPLVQRYLETRAANGLRLGGILSRGSILSRLRLTPEGIRLDEAKALTLALLRRGQRVFHLTLHSTSVVIGGNPYTHSEDDRSRLLAWMDAYLDFFTRQLHGVATTPQDILLSAQTAMADPAGARAGATPPRQSALGS